MGCGTKCAKFLLIVFNIIFWLSGIALIVIGAIYAADPGFKYFQSFVSPNDKMLLNGMYVLIGIGCFVFIFGFCGCCGAMKESQCLLGIYIVFMVIVMIAELAIGIYVGVKQKDIEGKALEEMMKLLKDKYPPETTPQSKDGLNFKNAIDGVQNGDLKCCGVNGSADWMTSNWRTYTNATGITTATLKTPRSCCTNAEAMTVDGTYTTCQTSSAFHPNGCWSEAQKWIKKHFPIVIGVGCGIACLEILGLICALALCCNIRKESDKYA